MGEVTGVFHAVICVSEMASALKFSRDVLGLRVTYDAINDPKTLGDLLGYDRPEAHQVIVECPDGSEIELAEFRKPRGRAKVSRHWSDAGINFLSLRVNGIEALMARITAAGYRFTSGLICQRFPDGTIKVATCYDPDDTFITLVELPVGKRTLGKQEEQR
jgi:catechol 2,3-dioxygenase-like lactoylglutathione lyase family enzyme